ncbi:hypothetical protein [Zobellia uliginosa]|uniref:hypothetical protein n=1 Tax=Zobellia uliginosa TaxID=143224 RepID=UPI001C06AFD6|nr:hypothetical protein [Zobellia uliginosa]MBU2948024.1 hypothetical protein [Zobellia uliginosa]
MKNSLIYFGIFLALLFAFDKVLAYTLDFIIDHSDFRYVNLFHEEPDIYVVGNSRAVYAVCESEFDKKYDLDILNISFTRLSAESIQYLTSYVNKDKLLLIEVSPFLSQNIKEKGTISPIFNSIKGLRNNDDDKNILEKFFKSFNFNNRATLRLFYHLFKTDKNWVQNREINPSIIEKLKNTSPHELHLTEEFFRYQEILEEENYSYVFFHAPYHPIALSKIKNLTSVHRKLDSLTHNKFIDLTDLLHDDKYFADGIHTNYKATDLIHKNLLEHIKP